MKSSYGKNLGIRDIAKLAGVSTATVSRVINTPEVTSQETYEKVMNIIKQNNYVPNQIARNFISGSSNSIGFMVFDLRIPFYVSIIQHLNQLALENGMTLMICDTGTSIERELTYYQHCRSIRVTGIVLTEGWVEGWYEHINDTLEETSSHIPIVLLDRDTPSGLNCYSVKSDHKQGISLLVEYLHNLGHKEIGFICGPDYMSSAVERYASYKASLSKYNIPFRKQYIFRGDFSQTAGMDAFDYYESLETPPTALIAADDNMAKGFILKANSCGVKIPEKYSICGIDGIDPSDFFPQITTIRQNTKALSHAIFDFIVNFETIKPPQQSIIGVDLFEGQTCCKI
ncbi:MAG: LacI family DNA-binding transcriptional regulator [Christensenellaceae bacterium]|jgi:LacI family repressor for deo operon, udp, cdd, tsx, nupC, and nupG